jgi:hypothetical protein
VFCILQETTLSRNEFTCRVTFNDQTFDKFINRKDISNVERSNTQKRNAHYIWLFWIFINESSKLLDKDSITNFPNYGKSHLNASFQRFNSLDSQILYLKNLLNKVLGLHLFTFGNH